MIGLVLPTWVDLAPNLVAVAATGLAAIVVVAVIVHIRIRDRFADDARAVVLGLLATFVAGAGSGRTRSDQMHDCGDSNDRQHQ